MAIIRVCDICSRTLLSTQYKIERTGFMGKTYDVCPDCMNKITEWIKEKTEVEDEFPKEDE